MDCIYCKHKTSVVNSRPQKADHQTWRRRSCQNCNAIVTTIEAISLEDALRIEKRNGTYEPFYRDKLYLSVYKAIDHLHNPAILATHLTSTILRHYLKGQPLNPVISSATLANHASTVLKRFDAAASVRYLSFQTSMPLANDIRRKLK